MSKKVVTKHPHGGLTAAGRRVFARKEGTHLKPGREETRRRHYQDRQADLKVRPT